MPRSAPSGPVWASQGGSLGHIGEPVLLYQGERGRPKARRMLTETTPTQQRLSETFGLDRNAPRTPGNPSHPPSPTS